MTQAGRLDVGGLDDGTLVLVTDDGDHLAEIVPFPDEASARARADRLAATWNACLGLANPAEAIAKAREALALSLRLMADLADGKRVPSKSTESIRLALAALTPEPKP